MRREQGIEFLTNQLLGCLDKRQKVKQWEMCTMVRGLDKYKEKKKQVFFILVFVFIYLIIYLILTVFVLRLII